MTLHNYTISVEKEGPQRLAKQSFPLRYGTLSEIKTPDFEFVFNLNGEIKFIRGLNVNWPHPAEQLKRTDGNDWVYYTVGDESGDKGVISWMGEYYLPCLPYPSNPIWEIAYQSNTAIMNAFAAWSQLYANLYGAAKDGLPHQTKNLLHRIIANNDLALFRRSQALWDIIGGRPSVLPPDTRHVDYEVIPLTIADGCLYHCKFCCVQSDLTFKQRSRTNILDQIRQLQSYYGRNLANYYALFLGSHDALSAGRDLISFAASQAFKAFDFEKTQSNLAKLYLFGSVASLLKSQSALFEELNALPFETCINIGFESVDAATLSLIGKPVDATLVQEAFQKMLAINAAYANLEITGNFVVGEQLSLEHDRSLAMLLNQATGQQRGKGAIYLSPLKESPKKRELLPRFQAIKEQSRLPVYIYLIQRL